MKSLVLNLAIFFGIINGVAMGQETTYGLSVSSIVDQDLQWMRMATNLKIEHTTNEEVTVEFFDFKHGLGKYKLKLDQRIGKENIRYVSECVNPKSRACETGRGEMITKKIIEKWAEIFYHIDETVYGEDFNLKNIKIITDTNENWRVMLNGENDFTIYYINH
jgi:hypothetical protein